MSGKPQDQSGDADQPEITEPIPGIRVLPLRTPTLPPARHTNAYLVGGEKLIIVDPATYDSEERDKLLDHVERRIDRGAKIEAIVLTHHHVDHVGAATWLASKLKTTIAAHRITRELLDRKIAIDRLLDEGDIIDLGANFRLQVHFTPGHAPGHIVLKDLRTDTGQNTAMIVGDMVAGIGTIIVDPPEGNMTIYIRELKRLRAMPQSVLFPAHGPPQWDGHAKLDQYVAHRLMREEKVFNALLKEKKPATPYDLLPRAYDDTPLMMYGLAARSCLAHLLKLAEDGRVEKRGEKFIAAGPARE